jgi:oligopeptidase A
MTDNPLLHTTGLPRFDAIAPEHVEPGITRLLAELDAALTELERNVQPSWSGLVAPLERLQDRLNLAWGTVNHLLGVRNSAALRAAHEAVQPAVVAFGIRLGQSKPLYQAFLQLRAQGGLAPDQHRVVETAIRDAELSGVGLEGEAQARFHAVQTELADLSTRFSNHVLDATKAFALELTLHVEVAGLPTQALALAAQSAREAGHAHASAEHGPWRITLDAPSFLPFMQHATRRDLREELYRAYVTRASAGEFDNSPHLRRILELRAEAARLLGFSDYASLSLASKMAGSVAAIQPLLEELRAASYPSALRDLQELRDNARTVGSAEADDLQLWDVAFWAERLRESRFDYTDEQLRPYFPLPRVLEGMFRLAHDLFGVGICAADEEVAVWHPDVRYFRVADESGRPIAGFFLDPYARPADKRGGAWMDECVGRSRVMAADGSSVRLPVAYLVCNGTPPVDGQPSLMTFAEVETLLHEFGHGLQHMLTTVDEGLVSGIRGVEWDAVELPSQFMENWCYHEPSLRKLSGHVDTGEPLPAELFARIRAARTFRAGSDMLRQLLFASLDLELHHGFDPKRDDPFAAHRRVAARTQVLPPLPEDRFLCAFSHIFAGGYAAGYYSYKWAEVLSADAFAAFEEAGLDDAFAVQATGRRFRDTVLALGGSVHPMDVFTRFRGRPPSTQALLRHAGLGSAAA